MAQHAILRFEKHKGNPARPLEAHHERQKEQYASNPDIDTSRSKYNFHIVKPESRYYHFIQSRIEQLDGRKQELLARIAELTVEAISPEQVSQISGYLDTWENVSFDDKRRGVDLMITTTAATSDSLNITWKI